VQKMISCVKGRNSILTYGMIYNYNVCIVLLHIAALDYYSLCSLPYKIIMNVFPSVVHACDINNDL